MGKIRCLDAFTLKIVVTVLMVMDHSWRYFSDLPFWFHQSSRIVAPVFIFLMTESMRKTRDPVRYIWRMYFFGAATLFSNLSVSFIYFFKSGEFIFTQLNMILSLAVSASVLFFSDKVRRLESPVINTIIAAFFASIAIFLTEGKYVTLIIAVIFYFLFSNPPLMYVSYVAACFIMFGISTQSLMVLSVIPIMMYNGKRGANNNFTKYFFYVVYPLHLAVLFSLKYL